MAPSIEIDQRLSYDGVLPLLRCCEDKNGFESQLQVRNMVGLAPEEAVRLALVEEAGKIDGDVCDAGDEDSFFVADLGEIYRSLKEWKRRLPQVQPFYAVKCNPSEPIIKLLALLGCNFDCASKSEIDSVLKSGVSPERIIYANPCKTGSYIRYAYDQGIQLTTVDNAAELYKLKKYHPGCGILLRLATDDSTALCRLSTKFGCSVDTAVDELLPLASELGLFVRGVAFHVGSGAKDFGSIYQAVKDARTVFDQGIGKFGFGDSMNVLDIGGGFEMATFDQSSAVVQQSLAEFFPPEFTAEHGVGFIAEPGRFMVAQAFTLATHVIARRDLSSSLQRANDIEAMIYINDGVYGNLNCILFDHQHPKPAVLVLESALESLKSSSEDSSGDSHEGFRACQKNLKSAFESSNEDSNFNFSIWGPTCDGLDCVSPKASLSHNITVGDWLYFSNLGAYTLAAATSFNGFKCTANVHYIASEDLTHLNL